MNTSALTLAIATLAAIAAPATPAAGQGLTPPEVGDVAPPIGDSVTWVQVGDEDGGRAPVLADLRGHVVLVHTYGYFCDPCVRIAVPLMKQVRTANSVDASSP
jgi:thiol-disulfide isomerase/thioredoxin